MPVEVQQTPWARLRIASPGAVAVDLLRYPFCGIDRTASVIADRAGRFGRRRLALALAAADDVPTAQRLGFVLGWLGRQAEAEIVSAWLNGHGRRNVPLEPGSKADASVPQDRRWGGRGTVPEGMSA